MTVYSSDIDQKIEHIGMLICLYHHVTKDMPPWLKRQEEYVWGKMNDILVKDDHPPITGDDIERMHNSVVRFNDMIMRLRNV